MNKSRPKTRKNKSGQKSPENKKIKRTWVVLGGLAALALSGVFFFSQSGPKETSLRLPPPKQGWGYVSQSRPAPSGSKNLTLSPLPLTVENDLSALYEGAEPANPGDRFEWERNGAIIPGEESAKLKKNQLRKGDSIRARFIPAGGPESVVSVPEVVENTLPRITSIKIEPSLPTKKDTLMAKVEAFDADGDPISYTWRWIKGDGSVAGNEASFSASTLSKNDQVTVEVVPSDGQGQGSLMRASVKIVNAQPRITSAPTPFSGKEYSYQVTAEDPDKDSITFTLTKSPPGMTIDQKTGLIKWVFTEKDAGNHPIEIRVSDPEGEGDIQSFMLPLSFTTTPAASLTSASIAEK